MVHIAVKHASAFSALDLTPISNKSLQFLWQPAAGPANSCRLRSPLPAFVLLCFPFLARLPAFRAFGEFSCELGFDRALGLRTIDSERAPSSSHRECALVGVAEFMPFPYISPRLHLLPMGGC
jgi:hypothetical protein